MADTVTSQLIANGPRNWEYVLSNLSDGTGETGVAKVDGTSAGSLGIVVGGQTFYPGIYIKIKEIEYDIKGGGVLLQWDATSATDIIYLGGFGRWPHARRHSGIGIPSGLAGATGKILLTTKGFMLNSGYTLILRGTKNVPQS